MMRFTTILLAYFYVTLVSAQNTSNYKIVQQSFLLPTLELSIKNDYSDKITLHSWDKDSLKIVAKVYLVDEKNQSKNDDFDISLKRSGSISSLNLEIKNIKANYVFKKSGSDFDPKTSKLYKAHKALLIGSEIDIFIPENVNVEFESDMGDLFVTHNGGNLLITSGNNVTLLVNKSLNANLNLNSQDGEIKISQELPVKLGASNSGYKDLSNYILNNGGIEVSIIAFDDIIIKKSY